MTTIFNPISHKVKGALATILSLALCLTTISSMGIGTLTAKAVDSSLDGIATTMPDGTGLPNGIRVQLDESTWNESASTVGNSAWIQENSSGNHLIALPRENGTFNDIATLVYENVATMNGQQVDATLKISKVVVSDIDIVSVDVDYNQVFGIWDSQFRGGGDLKKITFELTLTYHGTNNEVVGFPCWLEAIDLDTNDIQLDLSDKFTYTESYTMKKSDYDNYYVWPDCQLTASQDGDNITIQAPRKADSTTDDDDRYYKAGFIAATSKGDFNATVEVATGCGNILYAYVSSVDDPVKTVTSTGSNSDGSYAVGDTVEFEVEQTMPQLYKDAYSAYDNISMRDILPEGLTYQSATMYINGEEASDSDGTMSYDSSSRTVTYKFSDEFVANLENYNGQTLKMVVTATADATDEASKTLTNVAYTNISDVDFGPAEATVDVETPQLAISKQADEWQYYVGDTITYSLQVTETNSKATAKNVVISDDLPDGLELIGTPTVTKNGVAVTDCVTVNDDHESFSVSIDEISSSDVVTVTVKARAHESTANTTVKNTAIATAENTYEPVDDDEDVKIIEPVLSISKDADGTDYGIDDVVTYTIKVTETQADVTAYNVVVTDTLPSELELIDVKAEDHSGSATKSGNGFTVKYASLEPNDTATITVTAKAISDKEGIVNTAVANADHTSEVKDDSEITVRRPALSITKSAASTTYSELDTVTYSIDVSQTVGGLTAKNVVVSDTLPSELELTDVTAEGGTVSKNGNSFTVTYDELPYGQTNHIVVTAKAVSAGETVTNTAKATGTYCDEVEDDADITIRRPDISIEKTVDQDTFYPGDTATYTLVVTNVKMDPNAYNVVVSDTLPDGLTLQSVDANGEVETDGNSFTVTYETIPYGESQTITVKATVEESAANSELHNVGYAKADNADEVDDYADINVIKPILNITKEADKSSYSVDEDVTYTISATQTIEGLTAENVIITDTLPDEMELVSAEISGVEGTVDTDGNSLTVNCPALAYGETATITVSAKAIAEGTDVVNIAKADADHADPVEDDATVNVANPDLTITKDVDSRNHFANDEVIYTIKVAETVEGGEAYDVVVSDTMPDGITLEDVATIGKNGDVQIDGNSFTVTFDKIGYEDEVEITVTAKADDVAKGSIADNIAKVSASNVPEKQDDAEIEVVDPELSIVKEADKDSYEVGELVTFTITVNETVEDMYEENVVISDLVPDGLTLKAVTLDGVEGTVNQDVNDITVTIPKLMYEETAVVTITATPDESLAGQSVVNTAYVKGDHTDEISDDAEISITETPKDETPNDTPVNGNDGYNGANGANGADGASGGSSSVQTGDNYIMYILLACAALLLIGGAILIMRRRKN